MTDVLMWFSRSSVPYTEVLYSLAVALVLIDYFFPVDYPAYLGYLCFSLATFFVLPLPGVPSLLLALSVLVLLLLLLLHSFWVSKYLTNSPHTRGVE